MKTKTAVLKEKLDAGNPHIRFGAGEVVSAKPRRESLLNKNKAFELKKSFWKYQLFLFGREVFSCSRARDVKRIYHRRHEGLTEDEVRRVIEWQYKVKTGYDLDILHPQTFTEKLQWIKWKRRDPLMVTLSDKVAARDYIREKAGEKYLVRSLGVWDDADKVDFASLPERFAIKVNWGCRENIICVDRAKFDESSARVCLRRWMQPNANHYYNNLEWAYKDIPGRIIAEEFLDDGHGLRDYKFFCFKGEPKFLQVCDGRKSGKLMLTTYDCDFKRMDIVWGGEALYPGEMEKPVVWDEMLDLCRKLSAEMPFLRVDLYYVDGQVKAGELTCYPGAGWLIPEPYSFNYELGKLLPIPELGEK